MKLISLFDGSGGFPLAGAMCGIEPILASEVEPYPIAVTRSRFPNMKHLGDISKIHGYDMEPAEIITFGSPCQDLSVAGKRAGMKHEGMGDEETTRSGLFMEAIRIIKEMRESTNGKYPRYAVWENVPGAFSSNKGEDFRVVLEEFIRIKEPTATMPAPDKNGLTQTSSWETDGALLTEFLTLNIGESPSVADESTLSQILIPNAPEKYYLSAKACEGILRRAERRGKTLPPLLKTALEQQIKGYPCVLEQPHPVCYGIDRAAFNQGENAKYPPQITKEQSMTIVARGPNAVCVPKSLYWNGDTVTGTLTANNAGGSQRMPDKENFNCVIQDHGETNYIVRRLTPVECARLQGFPDWWGQIDVKEDFTEEEYLFWSEVRDTFDEINGRKHKIYTWKQMLTWYNKLHTDSAEYKMWGNGIALPCAYFVLDRISKAADPVAMGRKQRLSSMYGEPKGEEGAS